MFYRLRKRKKPPFLDNRLQSSRRLERAKLQLPSFVRAMTPANNNILLPIWPAPPKRSRRCVRRSRLRPRHVVPKPGQTYEPEVPVEVREWIAPAPSSPDFVLEAQPPAQPHRRVGIERPIRLAESAYRKVVRPSAQRAVHFAHQRRGLLPCACSLGQRVDFLDRALNAFL